MKIFTVDINWTKIQGFIWGPNTKKEENNESSGTKSGITINVCRMCGILPLCCQSNATRTTQRNLLHGCSILQSRHWKYTAPKMLTWRYHQHLTQRFLRAFVGIKLQSRLPLAASDHDAGRLCISQFCLLSRRLDIIFRAYVCPEVPSILSFSSLCPRWFVALTRVDSIRCEDKTSSLITVVKPGKRLGVYHFTGKLPGSVLTCTYSFSLDAYHILVVSAYCCCAIELIDCFWSFKKIKSIRRHQKPRKHLQHLEIWHHLQQRHHLQHP